MTAQSWIFSALKIFLFGLFLIVAERAGNSVPAQQKNEYRSEEIVFDEKAYTHPVTGACVVAIVDGVPIYDVEIEHHLSKLSGFDNLSEAAYDELYFKKLMLLINRQFILKHLTGTKYKPTEQELDLEVQQIKEKLESQGTALEDFLTSGKRDEAMLRKSLAWNECWRRYTEEFLTEVNLKRFFEKNHKDYDGTKREVRQIVFLTDPDNSDPYHSDDLERELILLRNAINRGKTTFEEGVKQHSHSPTKENGGTVGWLERTGDMHPQIHRAAFTTEIGKIHGPIHTPHGFHLIKVTAEKPGTKSWESIREEVYQAAQVYLFNYTAGQKKSTTRVMFTGKIPGIEEHYDGLPLDE